MEREIDVSARHLIDWLRADPAGLTVRATREYLWDGAPLAGDPEEAAGLDSDDEIEVATTVGLVEVRPERGSGWVLRVRVENPLACHLPEDGSVADEPEEIGLDEFEACFLGDEAEDGAVTVEADRNPDARAFDKVLAAILASRRPA
ncbi:MAG TPA: hypothetical protein VM422_02725 [Amaricoccus sp.]|jgi:hypothetical protein|nr:hypothetical protein [Amaricoccus sp.]